MWDLHLPSLGGRKRRVLRRENSLFFICLGEGGENEEIPVPVFLRKRGKGKRRGKSGARKRRVREIPLIKKEEGKKRGSCMSPGEEKKEIGLAPVSRGRGKRGEKELLGIGVRKKSNGVERGKRRQSSLLVGTNPSFPHQLPPVE